MLIWSCRILKRCEEDLPARDRRSVIMVYLTSVLLSLTAVTALQCYAKWRQLRKFQEKDMPAAMKSLVSSEDFAKAQAYQFDKLSFQLLGEYLGFVQTATVLVFGLLPWGWNQAQAAALWLGSSDETVTCMVFCSFVLLDEWKE